MFPSHSTAGGTLDIISSHCLVIAFLLFPLLRIFPVFFVFVLPKCILMISLGYAISLFYLHHYNFLEYLTLYFGISDRQDVYVHVYIRREDRFQTNHSFISQACMHAVLVRKRKVPK